MTEKRMSGRLSRRDFIAGTAGLAAAGLTRRALAASTGKLGVALVGLGYYATHQLAPALQETKACRLAGVVTGTPSKAREWREKYGIPEDCVYDYDTFDRIADNPDIDIVYVVLPNSMHAEFTIRAAKAGKHVICEKPMAVSVEESERMIAACRAANRQLAVGYRLHFEPYNREIMRLSREKTFGPVRLIHAEFGFPLRDRSAWRLHRKWAGGGPLMDVGIYCIQAARYASGEEPVAVTAQQVKTRPDLYVDVEETLTWQMEFPSGALANCATSYATYTERLEVCAEDGWYRLRPAYGYGPLAGETSAGKLEFPDVREQVSHMDAVAEAILKGEPVPTSGEQGLKDMKIIDAIYRASLNGRREPLRLA